MENLKRSVKNFLAMCLLHQWQTIRAAELEVPPNWQVLAFARRIIYKDQICLCCGKARTVEKYTL